jgi:Uma2 family endonuclease
MHMPVTQRHWTTAAVRALPDDGNRYELIGGELLVTPAPRWSHQEAVGELHLQLRLYLDREAAGHVMLSPADIELEPGTIVQPDVFVLPGAQRARAWTPAGSSTSFTLDVAEFFRATRAD